MDINNYTPTRETTHWSVPFERNATFQNTNDWHDCSECLTTQTVFFQVTTADALEVISSSRSGRITCPIGFYINVKTICVSVQGQSIEVVPRVTRDPFNGATISRYLYEGITKLASGTNGEIKAEGLRLDVGQTLKMSAKTDNTANARVFGSVNMELVSL